MQDGVLQGSQKEHGFRLARRCTLCTTSRQIRENKTGGDPKHPRTSTPKPNRLAARQTNNQCHFVVLLLQFTAEER